MCEHWNNIISIRVVKCSTSCFEGRFFFFMQFNCASGKNKRTGWKFSREQQKQFPSSERKLFRKFLSLKMFHSFGFSSIVAWLTTRGFSFSSFLSKINRKFLETLKISLSANRRHLEHKEIMNLSYVKAFEMCLCVRRRENENLSSLSRVALILLHFCASFYASRHPFVCAALPERPIISKWTEHFLFKSLLSFLLSLLNAGGFLSLHILSFHIRHNTRHATPCMKIMKRLFSFLQAKRKLTEIFNFFSPTLSSLSFLNENKFN